jgi:DNA-binding SARP family transcriptional activator
VDEIERIVARDGVRGFQFFADCARGRDAVPAAPDLPRWILAGYLIAAAQAERRDRALGLARQAASVAARYPNPLFRILAALALGELATGAERDDAYAHARRMAAEVAAPALVDTVERAASGDATGTMLGAFVRRYRSTPLRPAGARLEISMLHGTVAVRGTPVKLGDRELALILALARRRKATSREELIDALWPDRDADTAANSLNVCVHRARAALGDEDAVERTRNGLRLCDDAVVDLWEIEREVAHWRATDVTSDADAATVRALYERLRAERPARFAAWEWFDRIERSLQELRCELGQRLARYALASGRTDEALKLATEMIAYDACHEVAHEIAIAAYKSAGDRAAALRHYRQYRETLQRELDCEPSPALRALLEH